MSWSITVYEHKNYPYIVNNIVAENEEEAIYKAKKFVASNGYFPGLSIKRIMDLLKVEKVVKVEDLKKE